MVGTGVMECDSDDHSPRGWSGIGCRSGTGRALLDVKKKKKKKNTREDVEHEKWKAGNYSASEVVG